MDILIDLIIYLIRQFSQPSRPQQRDRAAECAGYRAAEGRGGAADSRDAERAAQQTGKAGARRCRHG